MEASLGVDLATVRIWDDGTAAAQTRAAGADAMTVGEDVAFAPGLYRPDTPAGRTLVAHEITHVVQQRTTGPRPQFQEAGSAATAAPAEEPIWISVTLHGLTVTSPGRLMPAGEPSQRAYLRLVLRRLAPAATPAQLDAVLDEIARTPTYTSEGDLLQPGRVIPEGERFTRVTIRPAAFASVAVLLEQQGVSIALSPEQRTVLRLGVAADAWADEGVRTLSAEFPWYEIGIWHAQLAMHTRALADSVAAEDAAPAGSRPAAGRDALLAVLRRPLEVLEATRRDVRLGEVPAGPVTDATRGAAKAAEVWRAMWRETASISAAGRQGLRISAIQFYWTAPTIHDPAKTDRAARIEYLRRMSGWFQRRTATVDPQRDYTQDLVRDPGRFTDQPFPAHLEAVPAPAGDLRVVPAHADHRYRFSVDFHDVFDAFGSYAYRWDVLGWRAEGAGASPAQAIRDIESGRTDAAARTTGRRSTGHGDVLAARLGRDLAHARADVARLTDTFGPASVTMAPTAVALFALRGVATAVRTLIDVVTLEHGAGVRERIIQLPGPGLWLIRAAAVPIFDERDEVHRAPSVAYIPVYALPQRDLAEQSLADAISAADAAERARDEAQAALRALSAPDADPALRAMAAELAADPRLGSDHWAALTAIQRDMEARLAEIEASLGGSPPPTPDQASLLRSQRDALRRQIDQNRVMLTTHRGRLSNHPNLATPQQLMISFVSDDGQTLPLAMEWAEQTRTQTSLAVTMTAPVGSTFVVLSDRTSPNGGLQEASGLTLDAAVRNAVTTLLESRSGYGRGLVAMRLPGGRSVTFRIEASLGQLFNEALDSAMTLITVAALAAAPFTAGASLTILVPVGVVAGVRAAERMYARYDASTLRWDLQTLQDFVDIASAAVGVGAAVRGARAGMQVTRIGRITAISFDVAQNVTGFVILGAGLQEQLRAIDETPGLSAGERRARRTMAIGGAMVSAGMQGGSMLIAHAYGSRTTDGDAVPAAEAGLAPEASGPAPRPPTEVRPAEVRPPPADSPTRPAVPETVPPVAEPGPLPRPAEPPAAVPEVVPPAATPDVVPPAATPEVVPPTAVPDVTPPATSPAAPARPRTVDDLLTSDGRIRPEYPDLRQAWEAYADGRRTRGRDPLTPREWALSQTRGGPASRLGALLPRGWRRGARATYPGARPRAVALAVPSPEPGSRVPGTSLRWTRRIVRTEELRPLMDNTGETYWSFPELRAGEVLVLPNGSRIWIDPASGAIVDSNPVGPSISAMRGVTRGEEAMFAAGDRSQAHVDAHTQRLHGATSPGLGGDAPYSIAGGPRHLNLVIENSGIEAWVRALRTNAPDGVDYVFTTRTLRSPRGDLISRSYSVAALEGGRATPIADFEVRMRGGGITAADVEVPGWHVHEDGMRRYGAPRLRTQPASRPVGGDVSVGIPDSLSRAVGGGTAADPRVASVVTDPLQAAQQARGRLGGLFERMVAQPGNQVELAERLFALDEALAGVEARIAHSTAVDPDAMARLNSVVARINEITLIRTRSDRISSAELRVLARMLDRIAPH